MSEFNPRTPDDSSGDQTRFEEIVSSLDQDGGLTAVAEKMATIAEYDRRAAELYAKMKENPDVPLSPQERNELDVCNERAEALRQLLNLPSDTFSSDNPNPSTTAEELLLGVDGIELPTEQDEFNAKIREQLPQQIADIKQRIQEIYDTYFNDDGVQIRLVPRAIINRLNRDIRMTVAMGKRLGLKVDLNEITGVNVAEGRITSFIRAIGEMLRPREY
jgi:hypothetical protein